MRIIKVIISLTFFALLAFNWPTTFHPSTDTFYHIAPLTSDQLIGSTQHGLYRINLSNENTFKKHSRLLTLPKSNQIQKILRDGDQLLLLSDERLYQSQNLGQSWKILFRKSTTREAFQTLTVIDHTIFLGTSIGLYISSKEKIEFKRITTFPRGESPIDLKVLNSKIYFILTDKSLWKTRDGGLSFTKLLGNIPKTISTKNEFEASDQVRGSFAALEIDEKGEKVWVSSKEGLFYSASGGLRFQKIVGVAARITKLLFTKWGLILGTHDGVFILNEKEITRLESYTHHKIIHDLAEGNNDLWISSESGVTKISFQDFSPSLPQNFIYTQNSLSHLNQLIQTEPTIREVQKAVIRYSNTPNGKIKSWQIFSRLKSLLPTVSYSLGSSKGNNIDLDRGGTKDPDIYIAGPNDLDKSIDWDLKWDLGDLLFSSAQTSIDSREKLMVELREELVSEVTRLYFERRRLQMDLLFLKPQGKELLDAWIRVEELTAQIDGMTGGFFAKKLKKDALTGFALLVDQSQLTTGGIDVTSSAVS